MISPDGKSLLFRTIDRERNRDIYYRRLDGDTTIHPFEATRFQELMPRFSPDGRWVAYVSDESNTSQVYVRPFPGPGGRVQVSAAGALLPIQLGDQAFQAMHPYLPLTWVVSAFRASLFGAYDGAFWPQLGVVWAIGAVALAVGTLAGRWRLMPLEQWRPPLDIE